MYSGAAQRQRQTEDNNRKGGAARSGGGRPLRIDKTVARRKWLPLTVDNDWHSRAAQIGGGRPQSMKLRRRGSAAVDRREIIIGGVARRRRQSGYGEDGGAARNPFCVPRDLRESFTRTEQTPTSTDALCTQPRTGSTASPQKLGLQARFIEGVFQRVLRIFIPGRYLSDFGSKRLTLKGRINQMAKLVFATSLIAGPTLCQLIDKIRVRG